MTATLPPEAANPYPGLRPFQEEEEHLFFGRERQIDRMVDILGSERFLAVVGSSGSGKSSLVTCGLQPALRRGLLTRAGTRWRIARCRPGLKPIEGLAASLAASLPPIEGTANAEVSLAEVIATDLRLNRRGLIDLTAQSQGSRPFNLLVVVDQFEELFRYSGLRGNGSIASDAAAQEDAIALVNLLLATRDQREQPIFVVLTMRSDFLGDCSRFTALPEAINASLYLVPRLTREERRQAILHPALVSGTTMDPVLVTQLVNDVGDNPDQLSILQHALCRTWSHWRQRGGVGAITGADYEAIGTMATALDSHAEQTLADCGDGDSLALCGRLFRALTDKASDPRGIRRPTTLERLQAICDASPPSMERLINHFRRPDRAFLMPPANEALRPESVIDISHESLMRVWRRLDQWADAEAESAALFLRLADAARRQRQGQGSLWRDPELQLALNWRDQETPNPAWADRYDPDLQPALAFLETSQAAREDERRQRRVRRRLTVAGLASLSLLSSLVAAFCWSQWQQTRLSRARAFAATAAALLPNRPRESLLYGLAAMERLIHNPAEAIAVSSILADAARLNWDIGALEGGQPVITALLRLRNGDWLTAGADGSLQRWRDGRPLGPPIASGQGEIRGVVELANGVLVSGGADGSLRGWRDGRPLGPPRLAGDWAVLSLVQLSDGDLVSGDERGLLRRWRDLKPVGAPIPTGQGRVTALLALPGGELLSGGSASESETAGRTLRRWRRGQPVGAPIPTPHDGIVQLLARGDRVFSLGSEGGVRTWRVGQAATAPWPTGPVPVRQLTLISDGDLVSSHDDGSLRRWRGGKLVELGYASSSGIRLLAGLEGERLLGADSNGDLHLLRPGAPILPSVDSRQNGVWSLLPLANGEVVSGGEDGSLRRWRRGRPVGSPVATGQGSLLALARLANGDLLSGGSLQGPSGERKGSLRRWRGEIAIGPPVPTQPGTIRQLLPEGNEEVLGVADGEAEGSVLGRWRVDRGAPIALGSPNVLPPPRINSLVRLPDGNWLSASRLDGQLRRWRWRGGALEPGGETATGLDGIGSLAVLAGDGTLVIGSVDRRSGGQEVRVLDLHSQEWLGQPLKLTKGWASALAVLPNQGLVIGTTEGELRWIEPRRILAAACGELGQDQRSRHQQTTNRTQRLVARLARQACAETGLPP